MAELGLPLVAFLHEHRAVLSLILVGAIFVAFITERYPPAVIACAGAAVFLVLGYIDVNDAFSVFSNSAPITIAALFMLTGALVRTGTLDAAGGWIVGRAERRPGLALATVLAGTVLASAFMNNTPVVLVLIPIVLRLAAATGQAPSKLLIPLSYAAILGGTCTIIGTSTNILVDGIVRARGLPGFSIFDITAVGVTAAVGGGLAMLWLGRFLLPVRPTITEVDATPDEKEFFTEVTVPEGSPLIGRLYGQASALTRKGMSLTAVFRKGREIRGGIAQLAVEAGDRVLLLAPVSEIATLNASPHVRVGLQRGRRASAPGTRLFEAVVAPNRRGVHLTLANMELGARYGVTPVAVHRYRHIPGSDLASVRLRAADILLLEGTAEGISAMMNEGDFLDIGHARARPYRRRRAPLAIGALVGVVGLATFDVLPIAALAMIAVGAILAFRCVDLDEAINAIDGSVLLLILGMLAIGLGLENTGALQLVVDAVAPALQHLPLVLVLLAIYFLTSVLTEAVTNNAVAVILAPIAIGLADQLGLDVRPLVVAVMFGASASFATPIGYQTNTLVYGAGNYRFLDFVKIGVPMNVIVGIVTCIAISALM